MNGQSMLAHINMRSWGSDRTAHHWLRLQAVTELKRLTSMTVGAAGAASQGALNRQQMADLLNYASGAATQAWPAPCCGMQRVCRIVAHGDAVSGSLPAVVPAGSALLTC